MQAPVDNSADDLLAIFTISKLRDLKKHCRSAVVTKRDFANFILCCMGGAVPFFHTPRHREFVPEHLVLSDGDLGAIASNGIGKFKPDAQTAANKVHAIFAERRMLSGHMFQNQHHWHFFYFDNHDYSDRDNHWKGGPHMHLINHLYPGRTAQSVWDEFCDGNPFMKGALHIRLER